MWYHIKAVSPCFITGPLVEWCWSAEGYIRSKLRTWKDTQENVLGSYMPTHFWIFPLVFPYSQSWLFSISNTHTVCTHTHCGEHLVSVQKILFHSYIFVCVCVGGEVQLLQKCHVWFLVTYPSFNMRWCKVKDFTGIGIPEVGAGGRKRSCRSCEPHKLTVCLFVRCKRFHHHIVF